MKKVTLSLLFAAALFGGTTVDAKKEHILPIPQELTATNGTMTIAAGSTVTVAGVENNPTLVRFFKEFGVTNVAFDKDATSGTVVVKMVESISGAHDHELYGYDNEAYTLEVKGTGIVITAVNPIGVTRAAQTLTQLAEGYETTGITLECVNIKDWAAFKFRGYMHDIGRSFLDIETVKKHIDLLSRFKVNTFHWHMTENQAWRFEVKAYPRLTDASTMTRYAGDYYTQAQCKEVQEYAHERGIAIIPEIDMPGHSAAFERAMGFDMQSTQGREALKKILDEVVEVFDRSVYIHIGADEKATTLSFVNEMVNYVQSKGKKCMLWNPISGVAAANTDADLCQLWSTSGAQAPTKFNVDSRYNYTNHFDVFADLVGIYKSTIYYKEQGDNSISGTISGMWNDRKLATQDDIIKQNNFYANVIASLSRAWQGGGKHYIDNCTNGGTNGGGGVMLPAAGEEFDDFKDWEDRFLFHKAHSLRNEPIPYVKQTNVRWRISDAFPNNGNVAAVFPPEEQMNNEGIQPDTYTYEGQTYGTGLATGAGIYLRHTWGQSIINAFYKNPQYNQTAYAWTYVYSPEAQTVGAQIEFQNYSRSEADPVPANGNWDLMGSKIWLNGEAIAAPNYKNAGKSINREVDMLDENFTAREPIAVKLNKGWNKVFLKLPYINAGYRLDKWMFTFVLTDLEGFAAVDGLIYSPTQSMDAAGESVAAKISEVKAYRNSVVKDQPGYYTEETAAELDAIVERIEGTLSEVMSAADRAAQISELEAALDNFREKLATAALTQPVVSDGDNEVFYTLSTPLRYNRYATSNGANTDMVGETVADETAYWKFVSRTDGTYDIVNYADGTFISPNSANDTALKTQSSSPNKGWTLSAADEVGYFIITSGSVQFNQTNNASLGWKVYNWGSGTNKSDTGCKYSIQIADVEGGGETPEPPVVSEAFPKVGKYYYFYNKRQDGNVYFYDNNGAVGFAQAKDAGNAAYIWKCEANGTQKYDFKNAQTNKYFAWKALSDAPYGWTLDATVASQKVVNEGCVTLQGTTGTSTYLVIKNGNAFDQSTIGGYYNATFSSDYAFEETADPTGISSARIDDKLAAPAYDLSGRRVQQPAQGIYIIGGKKVLVK